MWYRSPPPSVRYEAVHYNNTFIAINIIQIITFFSQLSNVWKQYLHSEQPPGYKRQWIDISAELNNLKKAEARWICRKRLLLEFCLIVNKPSKASQDKSYFLNNIESQIRKWGNVLRKMPYFQI